MAQETSHDRPTQPHTSQSHKIETACIVIPTYNEAGNIKRLLDFIMEQDRLHAEETGISLQVLVVDDSSPDGTAEIVKSYRAEDDRVHLLLRTEKSGLGAAYIAGMRHAMELLDPDAIMEMDADFSHNPKDIYRLLRALQEGPDFVIGSRYVDGGSIPEDWGMHRKLISAAANVFTKAVLSIKDVQDCSGGFRVMRTSALRTIDLRKLDVSGYVFQVSLLDAFLRKGYTVTEVPIAFSDRTAGESKMGVTDIVEWGTQVIRMRARRFTDEDEGAAVA